LGGKTPSGRCDQNGSITGFTTATGKVMMSNPVYGHRIKLIRGLEEGTEI